LQEDTDLFDSVEDRAKGLTAIRHSIRTGIDIRLIFHLFHFDQFPQPKIGHCPTDIQYLGSFNVAFHSIFSLTFNCIEALTTDLGLIPGYKPASRLFQYVRLRFLNLLDACQQNPIQN
jgi:hypothetical protein